MGMLFGIVLGFPILRLRGDYLAIVTLGFASITKIVLENWDTVFGGPPASPTSPRLNSSAWRSTAREGRFTLLHRARAGRHDHLSSPTA